MNSESLIELKLDDCGLSAIPDLSALPNLRSLALAKIILMLLVMVYFLKTRISQFWISQIMQD